MNILTDEEIEELYFSELDNRELSFARAIEAAVLAKLTVQDVEPVAWMQSTHMTMLEKRAPGASAMLARCSNHQQHDDFRPIYTEAQLLAVQQRTAEACAKVCDEIAVTAWGCDSRFGEAVRNYWREYK